MSASVTITGRLGSDPEMKITPSGMAIANLRVVSSKRKKIGEEWQDVDTTWWRVTAFKTLAENVVESLSKGDLVVVVGTVKGREWEDPKTGEKRTVFEVTADEIGPGLSRAVAKPKSIRRDSGSATAPAHDPWATVTPTSSSDEIPF